MPRHSLLNSNISKCSSQHALPNSMLKKPAKRPRWHVRLYGKPRILSVIQDTTVDRPSRRPCHQSLSNSCMFRTCTPLALFADFKVQSLDAGRLRWADGMPLFCWSPLFYCRFHILTSTIVDLLVQNVFWSSLQPSPLHFLLHIFQIVYQDDIIF